MNGLKEYRGIFIALIAGVSAIICFLIAGSSILGFKEAGQSEGFTATGSASRDFTSDLIVWRGSFSAHGATTRDAYTQIKNDSDVIKKYLLDNGVTEDEIVFNSIDISKSYKNVYNDEGSIIDEVENGYNLYQSLSITSSDVDKIENISRDITTLIESGVEFFSEAPEYYYTKLDELKLELIQEATKNAKTRIDILAADSGSRVGKLKTASLGVFQITAQNSDSEEYSYGGAFNTSSKEKTASITVRLNYSVN